MSINIKSDIFYHNSQDSFFRRPFGAAACGSTVMFRLMAPVGFLGQCTLRLWVDDTEILLPMGEFSTSGAEGEEGGAIRTVFEAVYKMPESPCLIWYYFCIFNDRSAEFYGNNESLLGGEGQMYAYAPNSFQITVHKPVKTPEWWKKGCIYQIFPDRFRNGNEDGHINSPKPGSLLQADWYDRPSYQKDINGRIMNWIFAGGNLKGVTAGLDYLKDLGVTILYLNPIFEARSSHRYDVGDYYKIDPVLGDQQDFDQLIQEGKKRGISILLDGVFSHTGSDSVYFNKFGTYGEDGAYRNPNSDYAAWYHFDQFPDQYDCWWGFPDQPTLNKEDQSFRHFICEGDDSVLRKWLRAGVKGFRLDVADELPDSFIQMLRKTMKEENEEAILIGEVWEDASNKTSYDVRKQYFSGEELDGVMNYPYYDTMVGFALGQIDGRRAFQKIMNLIENYPRENLMGCMTLLGSQDRPRILSVLGERVTGTGEDLIALTEWEKQNYSMPKEWYERAVKRLKMLTVLQMALPGTPSLYYGDEAGMQGFMDPYNRGTFPWGKEDADLQHWYKKLFQMRKTYLAEWMDGEFSAVDCDSRLLAFRIQKGENCLVTVTNAGEESVKMQFSGIGSSSVCVELMTGRSVMADATGKDCYLVEIPGVCTQLFYLRRMDRPNKLKRSGGILLHPTSLPGGWGMGDLGESAYRFVDFLHRSGQAVWQVLPLNPPTVGDSPYQAVSCFGGNPLLISIDKMEEMGYVTKEERNSAYETFMAAKGTERDASLCDFDAAGSVKRSLFQKAYQRFTEKKGTGEQYQAYEQFCLQNTGWIWDYGLYCGIKEFYGDMPWNQWPDTALKNHEPDGLQTFVKEHDREVYYHIFVQFLFFEQWFQLKAYANAKGISILGDMPIYAGLDSADVWGFSGLFDLDEEGNAKEIAGVPPDYFSENGQLWGVPVYKWENHKKQSYTWWISRIKQGCKLYDEVRLDHFRGFEGYWSVPAGASTAREGTWKEGPGMELFAALEKELGSLPFIAEDLGEITPAVATLKNLFHLPGMEIYQFSDRLQKDLEWKMDSPVVLYTGTHDNETLAAWLGLTGADAREMTERVIRGLYFNTADWVILPVQDLLGLGSEARMNIPGTVGGRNWRWRMTSEDWQKLMDCEEPMRVLSKKAKRSSCTDFLDKRRWDGTTNSGGEEGEIR